METFSFFFPPVNFYCDCLVQSHICSSYKVEQKKIIKLISDKKSRSKGKANIMEAEASLLTCAGCSKSIGGTSPLLPSAPASRSGQKWDSGDGTVGLAVTDTLCVYRWHPNTLKVTRQD